MKITKLILALLIIPCTGCNKPVKITSPDNLPTLELYKCDSFSRSIDHLGYFGTRGNLYELPKDINTKRLTNKIDFESDISDGEINSTYSINTTQLSIIVDTAQNLPIEQMSTKDSMRIYYHGYAVYLINNSLLRRMTVIDGDGFGIIQEAQDINENWKPIEYNWGLWGQPLSFRYTLYPSDYLIAIIPKYSGNFETMMRVKLISPFENYYSEPFNGSISLNQFIIPDKIKVNDNKEFIFKF